MVSRSSGTVFEKRSSGTVRTQVLKRRPGTMQLNAANSYPHLTYVTAGTLKFGVSNCLPSTNEVKIVGGAALSMADATTNAVGLVTFERNVAGASRLVLGANAQLSIDSVAFDSGASVSVVGVLGERSLRIGTSASLSAAELSAFTCEAGWNSRVTQDADGWLHPAERKGMFLIFR